MKTEQRIKEIAEELKQLIHVDNDTKRFIQENLSKFLDNNIEYLESEIKRLAEENIDLQDKINSALRVLD